jgi:multidrug resistance efflux pump
VFYQVGFRLEVGESSARILWARDSDAQPDVRLAIRELEVATAALAQAEQELAGARVTATLDGTVIAIHVRVGENGCGSVSVQ